MTTKDVIDHFWEAFSTRDMDAMQAVLKEDLTWTVVGQTHPTCKTYHGWDGFLGELLGGLAEVFEPGTLKMNLIGKYVDEDQGTGILHQHETGTLKNGKQFEVEIAIILKVRDGKIFEVREIMDVAAVINGLGG